jgi:hypothetical protein
MTNQDRLAPSADAERARAHRSCSSYFPARRESRPCMRQSQNEAIRNAASADGPHWVKLNRWALPYEGQLTL